MYLLRPDLHTRRAFLRRSAQLAATGVALPTALNLAAMGEAAAQQATDYKALVCVFLYGGNDYANTVVTYDDPSHALYTAARGVPGAAGSISIAKGDLTGTLLTPNTPLGGGRQFALHPAMTGLANLFNTGKAAVQMNVGPLVKPVDKAGYLSANRQAFPLPPKLFSHNDQQSIWQSSSGEGSTAGWGGNIGDLSLSTNGAGSLFTCVSITGNAVFLSGDTAQSYQVGSSGPVNIYTIGTPAKPRFPYGFKDVGDAMGVLTTGLGMPNLLEKAYNSVTKRAVDSEASITTAIDPSKAVNNVYPAPYATFGTANPLADQMRMVARLIAARDNFGVKRQVFMVSLGGFDLHDNLIANQPTLMKRISDAMTAFYDATVTLGVADKVTAFTASDFGRTMANNGDGSDHGWGSHQLMVGGAVKGKAFYGYAPPVSNGDSKSTAEVDQWSVGQGRLLPTTSVDQYAATMAKWFGVPDDQMSSILPNLGNFNGQTASGIVYPANLGFME